MLRWLHLGGGGGLGSQCFMKFVCLCRLNLARSLARHRWLGEGGHRSVHGPGRGRSRLTVNSLTQFAHVFFVCLFLSSHSVLSSFSYLRILSMMSTMSWTLTRSSELTSPGSGHTSSSGDGGNGGGEDTVSFRRVTLPNCTWKGARAGNGPAKGARRGAVSQSVQ